MRVFVAIRHSTVPGAYYEDLWRGNFYPALNRLGHSIVESQTDLAPASAAMGVPRVVDDELIAIRQRLTQSILDEFESAHRERPIDLFLSYFYNAHFDPKGFQRIHDLGVPTVNFYCNSIHQFELVESIAKSVSFSWHAEKHARDSYLKAGANPVWVQMGADPTVYQPVAPDGPRLEKAVFIGQRYADRDRLAAALLRRQVPLDLYGSGWTRSGGERSSAASASLTAERRSSAPGTLSAYARTIRSNVANLGLLRGAIRSVKQFLHRQGSRRLDPILAKAAKGRAASIPATLANYELCLNFSNVWHDARPAGRLVPHVRLRDFEAPMCGAALLTGHTDEIEEFYEVGSEIDTYRDERELIDKTRFYLSRPDAADRLRVAGRRRALADHTWDRRFARLFQEIGLASR